MDPYRRWLREVLELAGEIFFQRMEAKLWAFAEALYAWLVDVTAHPTPQWRDGLESFLVAQAAEGRTITPDSRQSIENYVEQLLAVQKAEELRRSFPPHRGPFKNHPDNPDVMFRVPVDSRLSEEDALLAYDIASLTWQLREAVDQLKQSHDAPGLIEQVNPFAPDDLTKLRMLAETKAALSELELLWTLLGYEQIEWGPLERTRETGLRRAELIIRYAGPPAGLTPYSVRDVMAVWGLLSLAPRKIIARGLARLWARPATRLRVVDAGAAPRVNPGYPGAGRTQNCVHCALATDATLAGRPASALPSLGPRPISLIERATGGKFIKGLSELSDIEHVMSSLRPGARAIVFGQRAGRPGHVFNAVVSKRGTVKLFDGQTGKPALIDGFEGFRLLITNTN